MPISGPSHHQILLDGLPRAERGGQAQVPALPDRQRPHTRPGHGGGQADHPADGGPRLPPGGPHLLQLVGPARNGLLKKPIDLVEINLFSMRENFLYFSTILK